MKKLIREFRLSVFDSLLVFATWVLPGDCKATREWLYRKPWEE